MINVSPIGRNCSQEERDEFEKFDEEHNVRKTMIKALQENFGDYGLSFAIGGQISFDVYPQGRVIILPEIHGMILESYTLQSAEFS